MGRRKKLLPIEFSTENNNNHRPLPEGLSSADVAEVIQTIATAKSADKRQKFLMAWFFGLPMEKCATISGLSQSYCESLPAKYRKSQALRTHFEKLLSTWPETYRNVCKLRLYKLQDAEGRAVERYLEDPELLIKRPQLARQIKIAAGAMPTDDIVRPMDIDIGQIQVLIQGKFPGLADKNNDGNNEEH
jgi:hypothetical protein